jgi:hypothetical protein
MSNMSDEKSDKSILLTAFNTQFYDFLDDIESVFMNDSGIKRAKNALILIKKVNPSLVIKLWYKYIVVNYESEIDRNNINFFIEKDYKNDLRYLNSSDDIMKHIDSLREPVRNMGESNQQKSFMYIKNLCILSRLYSE